MLLLEGRLLRRVLAPGPAWATLCGLIASGSFNWSTADLLRLGLLLFLVEAGWSSVWIAATSPAWAEALHRWATWKSGPARQMLLRLPYLRPDAPGCHLARWLADLRNWWGQCLVPTAGPALSSLLIAGPLSLLLAAAVGPRLLLLTLGAFALTQLAFALGAGAGQSGPATYSAASAVHIALPWLAGHAAYAPLSPVSVGLALAFSLAYLSLARISDEGQQTNDGTGLQPGTSFIIRIIRPLSLLNLSQACVVIILIAAGRTVAGGLAGLLAFPILTLQPWLVQGMNGDAFVRRAQWPLMLAMLIAAL